MQGNPPALPRDLLAWLQSMRPALVGARRNRPSQTPDLESARSVTGRSLTMRQYPLRRRIRLCYVCLCSSLSASGVRNAPNMLRHCTITVKHVKSPHSNKTP